MRASLLLSSPLWASEPADGSVEGRGPGRGLDRPIGGLLEAVGSQGPAVRCRAAWLDRVRQRFWTFRRTGFLVVGTRRPGQAAWWGRILRRAGFAWGALAAGCWQPPQVVPLALEGFDQASPAAVYLNEELTLHFSEPLDPASIHGGVVRVLDERGASVMGSFLVSGRSLFFRPRLATLPDLSDGGLQPGRSYRFELAGFPRIEALRGRDGAPLQASLRLDFRTVVADPDALLFQDPSLAPPSPLTLARLTIGALDPLELIASEAIDPRSLDPRDFSLYALDGPAQGEARPPERIDLRLELVENRATGALLHLIPVQPDEGGARRALRPGHHLLVVRNGGPRLLDLGGNRILAGFGSSALDGVHLEVVGADPEPAQEGPVGWWFEDFTGAAGGSDERVEGVDGSALWTGDGRLWVRWPKAAGSGADGEVELSGPAVLPARLDATRLILGGEGILELPAEGLVCLRAQGRLEVRGQLRRRVQSGPARRPAAETASDWWKRLRGLPPALLVPELSFSSSPLLSEWLTVAERADLPWTVLIAGGDLTISGGLDLDGPLVLVAGGWVRIAGEAVASEWVTSLPRSGRASFGEARPLPLLLDAPAVNPLRVPLSYAVLSKPLQPGPGFERWLGARAVGQPGVGSYRLRYIGELIDAGGRVQPVGPVDDPVLLEGTPGLRFRADFELPSAESALPWDPPWLDSLRLWYSERR